MRMIYNSNIFVQSKVHTEGASNIFVQSKVHTEGTSNTFVQSKVHTDEDDNSSMTVCPPVWVIIHSLMLVDYLLVQVDKPWNNFVQSIPLTATH